MMQAPESSSAPPRPSAPVVRPEEGSRLDALAAEYATLQPQVEALSERLKTVTDSLKAELSASGNRAVLLSSPHLPCLLKCSLREEWRIDSKRLKSEHPATWVAFAKRVRSWRLDRVQG
jgi:hypothetical protein